MIDHRVHRHHGDLHMIMVVAYPSSARTCTAGALQQFRHEALRGDAFDPSHRQHRVIKMPEITTSAHVSNISLRASAVPQTPRSTSTRYQV
ncbi:hypothetical protein ACIBG0_04865 [Nocardia sp. NPDC050630]|uniref:hypothetical protein n=1 Tax=Nocardia sp. NPDC050630 TaxID=3364321 RepID=UPI003789AEC0